MPALPGYHGRYLLIDLTRQSVDECEIDETVLCRFIGGAGLGTWLLRQHCSALLDPLSESAPLIFVFSPLVGTSLTTSAKFAILAKSPLTQRINDSLSSSHFAIAGKKTGFDAFVIVGRAARPTLLTINEGTVAFELADELWGQSSSACEEKLKTRYAGFRFAAIGAAGERLVNYATISHQGRHAGRGGLGAVMGSKKLKAIAVRGSKTTPVAYPDELIRFSRELSERSLGPATAKYRELGTISNLLTFNRLGTLPTRNFQSGAFDGAQALAPEAMEVGHQRTRSSCAACTIGCEHIFQSTSSGTSTGVRMEYENLFALGPLCGVSDPNIVLQASGLCDEYGLDTISAGGTIAFAMECAERGLIDAPGLRFGEGTALLQMLHEIGQRRGLGDLLAQGSRAAAEQIGQGSESFAAHVKGLELPGYEPRALQTMALGLAVGARGADHNRSGAYEIDFSDRVNRFDVDESAAQLAIQTEDEAALMDSLIVCKFLRGVFDDRLAGQAEMLRLVTGISHTNADMTAIAQHIVTEKKRFNIDQGWTPSEDTLPARFLDEALADGASSGARLTRERLARLVRAYNLARGWREDGYVE